MKTAERILLKVLAKCGIITFEQRAEDGYNTIYKFYYKHSPSIIIDVNPGCKETDLT